MEGLADILTQDPVGVGHRIKGDRAQLGGVRFAVCVKDAFVGGDVDDLADDIAILVVFEITAFQGQRQLVEQRGVHLAAFGHMPAGLCELVGRIVARDHPHIVAGSHLVGGGKADGEGFPFLNVVGGLVPGAQAEHHLVAVVQPAPGRVHCVGGAVGVIGAYNQHRQRIQPGLFAKIFAHNRQLLFCVIIRTL